VRVICIILTASVLLVSSSMAGSNASHKVAVHVMSHTSRTCSKSFPAITSCADIVTTYADSGDIDVFPVFYELEEVTGIEYGLNHRNFDFPT